MAVTNRLKEIRIQKHINQSDLAFAIGSSRKSIGYIERGERYPSIEMALRIAAYLEVGIDELFILEESGN